MNATNVILRGRFRERLRDGTAVLWEHAWQSNLIVARALDLLAGLLTRGGGSPETSLRGILYWAVGEGDAAWDTNRPNASTQTTRLVREIYRKRLDPVRDISFNPATRTISLRVAFGPDQGAGTLREFGIFGGDATDARDSGYLINYKIHAPIDKTLPRVLERQLDFTIGPAPSILVPDLAGLNEAQARQALDEAKLAVGGIGSVESEIASGTVLSQLPNAGATVAEGIAVSITVARPITVVVPDLTGLTAEAAKSALAAANLQLSAAAPSTVESDAPVGTVGLQIPEANTRAPRNTEVTVAIATPRTVLVPDLSGLTIDAAGAALTRVHLQMNPAPQTQERSDIAPGVVILQAPTAGTRVNVGTSVQLTHSASPTVLVPDLAGLLSEAAKQKLSDAGLRLGGITSEPNSAAAQTIFKQKPLPGERVPRESTVDIVLASPLPVVMPNLAGMTLAQAAQVVQTLGLTMTAEPEHKLSHQPAETVVAQEPAAAAQVTQGTRVRITLATPIQTFVPDLIGKTFELARELLKSNNLALADPPTEVETPDAPPGTVLGQQPTANEQVAERTLVALTVATLVRVTVPNLVGRTQGRAELVLQQSGLVLNPQLGARATDVLDDDGRVAEQTPAADARALPGSAVAIVLWRVARVSVPGLLNLGLPEAKAALESVGLVLHPQALSQTTTNQPDVGHVAAQAPAAGETVLKGSTVQVTIWELAKIAVPSLVGLAEASAFQVLTTIGLKPLRVTRLVTDATQAGMVVDQKPAAGALLSPGGGVAFGVGVIAAFPELRCLSRDEAIQSTRKFADQFGIAWDGSLQIVNRASFEKPDSVVDQIPATGVPVGAQLTGVTLTVRKAPLPDVRCLDFNAAVDTLKRWAAQNQIALADIRALKTASDRAAGTVLAQDPQGLVTDYPTQNLIVNLNVAVKRPAPLEGFPELICLDTARAAELVRVFAAQHHAIVRTRLRDVPGERGDGIVYDQVPEPGEAFEPTLPIAQVIVLLTISRVPFPDVVCLDVDQAQAIITEATKGRTMTWNVQKQASGLPPGTVVAQSPLPLAPIPQPDARIDVSVTIASS